MTAQHNRRNSSMLTEMVKLIYAGLGPAWGLAHRFNLFYYSPAARSRTTTLLHLIPSLYRIISFSHHAHGLTGANAS